MVASQAEKIGYWTSLDEEVRAIWSLPEGHQLIVALFGELAHKDENLSQMPFEHIVDYGNLLNERRGYVTPEAERWHSQENLPLELRNHIKILSFEKPELRQHLIKLTLLVKGLYELEDLIDKGETIINGRDIREDLDEGYILYGELVDLVMNQVNTEYKELVKQQTDQDPALVTVTLKRGGLRFEKDFSQEGASTENGGVLSVEAKRLDMEPAPGEKYGNMMVGLGKWEGLDAIINSEQAKKYGIHLTFADDCVSSSVSIRAFITAYQERRKLDHTLPELKKVSVFATVGVQQGLIDLVTDAEAMGVEIDVITGDIAYSYSDLFYLERAPGERKDKRSTFKGREVFVGDMGHFLTKAAQARQRRQAA